MIKKQAKNAAAIAGLMCFSAALWAQAQLKPATPPPTPKADSPIDLTGYWVSIVNEDWRWRMLTPPKGDYASVPLKSRRQGQGGYLGCVAGRLLQGLRCGRRDAHADTIAHHLGGR